MYYGFLLLGFAELSVDMKSRLSPHITELKRIIGFEDLENFRKSASNVDPDTLFKCFIKSNTKEHCFTVDMAGSDERKLYESVYRKYWAIKAAFVKISEIPVVQTALKNDQVNEISDIIKNGNVAIFKVGSKSIDVSTELSKLEKRDRMSTIFTMSTISGISGISVLFFCPGLLLIGLFLLLPVGAFLSIGAMLFITRSVQYVAKTIASGIEASIEFGVQTLDVVINGYPHVSGYFYIKTSNVNRIASLFGADLVCYRINSILTTIQRANNVLQIKSGVDIRDAAVLPTVLIYLYTEFISCLNSKYCASIYKGKENLMLNLFLLKQTMHRYEMQIAWLIIDSFNMYVDGLLLLAKWVEDDVVNGPKTKFAADLVDLWSGECPICLEDMEIHDSQVTNCGHAFHSACIHKSDEIYHKCPICSMENPLEEQHAWKLKVWGIE